MNGADVAWHNSGSDEPHEDQRHSSFYQLRTSDLGVDRSPGMHDSMTAESDNNGLQFKDARGVTWTTGVRATEQGKRYRWFLAAGRLERRYELRNGEAKDESIASLRAQLHASVPISN